MEAANVKGENREAMRPYRNRQNEDSIRTVQARTQLETIYTYEETAHELDVSRATVSTWVRNGKATPRYIGARNGRMYLDVAEVERLRKLVEQEEGATGNE